MENDEMKPKLATVLLELQPYVQNPPVSLPQMYQQACSNDGPTINAWRDIWLNNIRVNQKEFGPFGKKHIGQLYQTAYGQTAIIAGSGPSLKNNIHLLKDRPSCIKLISCLHNFHAMEDANANVDYYVTLDAGEVVFKEVSEGGSLSPDEYWEKTADRKLIAFIGTNPEVLRKWKGKVYFYNAPVPDGIYREECAKIEPFWQLISNGGNVLGACMYFAKAWLGAMTTVFIGADFSFSNDESKKFHFWNSSYDKEMGLTLRVPDIFGNLVHTWASYHNFKVWFEYVTMVLPGVYINASEGGTFGAYSGGNLMSIKQLELSYVFDMHTLSDKIAYQANNPTTWSHESDVVLV